MILTIDTKALKSALASLGKVIPAKHAYQVYTHIKIATNDDRAILTGSDGDMTAELTLAATVETEGEILLPFAALNTFVGALKSDTAKLTIGKGDAKLSGGRNRITLMTLDAEQYPVTAPDVGHVAKIDGKTLSQALRFCGSVVKDEQVRFHIAGVSIQERDGDLWMFGTDGQALHKYTIGEVGPVGGGATLPVKSVPVVTATADAQDTVGFSISDKGWFLDAAPFRAWGKVVESAYPNADAVIAQFSTWQSVASVPKSDLSAGITIATCGAEQDSNKARNVVMIGDEGAPIVLRGQNSAAGVLHAGRAELDHNAEAKLRAVVSARHLTAALSGLDDADVILSTANFEGRDGGAVRVSPSQESAVTSAMALIMAQRATEAEMSDV